MHNEALEGFGACGSLQVTTEITNPRSGLTSDKTESSVHTEDLAEGQKDLLISKHNKYSLFQFPWLYIRCLAINKKLQGIQRVKEKKIKRQSNQPNHNQL